MHTCISPQLNIFQKCSLSEKKARKRNLDLVLSFTQGAIRRLIRDENREPQNFQKMIDIHLQIVPFLGIQIQSDEIIGTLHD